MTGRTEQFSIVNALDARPATTGVQLQNLTKSFRTSQGPVRAVRHVDISIAPGETVALLGPNGAGKSTTIDMLLGLLPPDTGRVSLFGMTPADAIQAGAIGAMLQTGSIIRDLNVRELITMMAALYPNPLGVDEVLALTGIEDLAGRRAHKLSGGQTQRVRFALALVSDPDLLVLDEPTVAMDVEGRHAFWTTMRRYATAGKTVVFATHYLEEADAYADRIILMARGEIVADGPATEIKATVGTRTIRATLPGADLSELGRLPGVLRGEHRRRYAARAVRRGAGPGIHPSGASGEDTDLRTAGGAEMSAAVTYTRYELLRTFRNRRFFIFSLAFPLILFLIVGGSNKNADPLGGIPFPVYYLAGMVSWGTMTAVVAGGARIAAERSVGWNRQLRLTPLSPRTYFRAKVLTGYVMSLASIAVLYIAAIAVGVRMPADHWLRMTGLVLVGLIPFAALGVWLGHVLSIDSMGPAMGGITSLFALLGGALGPLASHGFMHHVAELLPSYWLVQAGHAAYTEQSWSGKGWIVIAVWTAAFAALAVRAYRNDTKRV